MKRREFILAAGATTLLPAAGFAEKLFYKDGLVQEKLDAGETVFIDFYTEWCTTCASQQRTLAKLRSDDPAYEENITFVSVDWDVHSRSDLSVRLNIPRRSTLVVLKGDQELGRIVAGTSTKDIKALMDTALSAAV